MGLFDNKENNVGQFGADDTNIIRYKQAAEYALDAKMYAEYAAEVLVGANNTLKRAEEILAEVREVSSDVDEAVAKAEKAVVDANIALAAAQEALIAANNAVDHADQTAEEMKAYTKQITDETKAYSEQQANEAKAVAEQAKIDAIAAADAATLAANNAKKASEDALAAFQNMSTSAESVPYNQAAEAIFNHVTNDMHFKIPKGVDGKISDFGQAETRDPVDSDFVMISDSTGVVNKTHISTLAAMMPVSGFRIAGFWDVPTNVVEDVEYGLNTTVTPGTPPQVKDPDSVDGVQFKVITAGSFVIQTGEDPIDFAVGDILYWLGSRWYDDRQLITSVNGKRGSVVITKNDVGLDKVPNVDIYSKTESDGKYLNLLGGSLTGLLNTRGISNTINQIETTQNTYITNPADGIGVYWRGSSSVVRSKASIAVVKSPSTGRANMEFITGATDTYEGNKSVLSSDGIFQAGNGFMLRPANGNPGTWRQRSWGDPSGWANVFEISNSIAGSTEDGAGWQMRLTRHTSGAKDNLFNGTVAAQDGVFKAVNTTLNRTGTFYDDGNVNGAIWGGYLRDYLNNAGVSDARLKNNIKPTEKVALSDIDRIQFVDFDWGERYLSYKRVKDVKGGILAQSLEEIDPRYVTVTDTSSTGGDVDERGLDMNNLLSLALQGIQELSSEVKALKAELKSLKEKS